MPTTHIRPRTSILVLNPNSSKIMTNGMIRSILRTTISETADIHVYTAPKDSPVSINDDDDLKRSLEVVMVSIDSSGDNPVVVNQYNGILVACYSDHRLVRELTVKFGSQVAIMGIFEASILTALSLVQPFGLRGDEDGPQGYWGIVTTGLFWERHLTDALVKYLGAEPSNFAGVFSSDLNAGDFHSEEKREEEVPDRLTGAVKRLVLSANVYCVVLGCAGMTEMEDIVRTAASEARGPIYGQRIYVVDPVKAGLMQLERTIRCRRAFRSVDYL